MITTRASKLRNGALISSRVMPSPIAAIVEMQKSCIRKRTMSGEIFIL
jgi:hypothetical protein